MYCYYGSIRANRHDVRMGTERPWEIKSGTAENGVVWEGVGHTLKGVWYNLEEWYSLNPGCSEPNLPLTFSYLLSSLRSFTVIQVCCLSFHQVMVITHKACF